VDRALAETDQPYAYASDDPVNEDDPSGLASYQPGTPVYNNNTDISLFIQWVLGIYTNQFFTQNDPLTRSLMSDPHQQDVLARVRFGLLNGVDFGEDDYHDPSTDPAFIHDIILGYLPKSLLGNFYDADAFLGSYQESWTAIPQGDCTAEVSFLVTNTTDLNSFAHPEVITHNIIRNIDKWAPWIGLALLGDKNAFRPQHQTFVWTESVSYQPVAVT